MRHHLSKLERSQWCHRSNTEAATASIVALFLAFVVRSSLQEFLEDGIPTITFIFSTLYIAWRYGYKWGIFELVIGFLTATYFFVKPYGSFAVPNIADIYRLIYFFSVCLVTIFVFEKNNRDKYEASRYAELADQRYTELVKMDRRIG